MTRLKGLNKVINNLNKEVKKIEGKTLKGLIRAGLIVLRSVEIKSPLTPVDLGNLRASRFLVSSTGKVSMGGSPTFKDGKRKNAKKLTSNHGSTLRDAGSVLGVFKKPVVIFGFSAYYAAPVHEMTGVNWSRPGSGGKFLEKAIDNNVDDMLKVIAKEVKIK